MQMYPFLSDKEKHKHMIVNRIWLATVSEMPHSTWDIQLSNLRHIRNNVSKCVHDFNMWIRLVDKLLTSTGIKNYRGLKITKTTGWWSRSVLLLLLETFLQISLLLGDWGAAADWQTWTFAVHRVHTWPWNIPQMTYFTLLIHCQNTFQWKYM